MAADERREGQLIKAHEPGADEPPRRPSPWAVVVAAGHAPASLPPHAAALDPFASARSNASTTASKVNMVEACRALCSRTGSR